MAVSPLPGNRNWRIALASLTIAAPKGSMIWLARGLSAHLSRLYVDSLGRSTSVAVCGYPRSGTSWVSEALAGYYGLPCYRHYIAPKLHPQVLHTHSLGIGGVSRLFYLVRHPREVYISLFVKRYSIPEPQSVAATDSLRAQFADFLQTETLDPYEAPCRWSDHVAIAYKRFGADAVIPYTASGEEMLARLAQRITGLEGECDRVRLSPLVQCEADRANAPTTRTAGSLRELDWYDAQATALLDREMQRLWKISLPARVLPLFR
jgi:hypothetical protein